MMPPQFRLAAIVVIWIVTAVVLLAMIGTGYLSEGGLGAWILAISVAAIAGGVTSSMAEASKNDTGHREHKPWIDVRVDATDKGKAKRGQGFADLLALLDEDDAYELRQRIKNRLMEQIDRGEIDEAVSFEELLNSRERPKRK